MLQLCTCNVRCQNFGEAVLSAIQSVVGCCIFRAPTLWHIHASWRRYVWNLNFVFTFYCLTTRCLRNWTLYMVKSRLCVCMHVSVLLFQPVSSSRSANGRPSTLRVHPSTTSSSWQQQDMVECALAGATGNIQNDKVILNEWQGQWLQDAQLCKLTTLKDCDV